MSIVTEYPLWFLLFCLLLGGLYAYSLYAGSGKKEFSPALVKALGIIRFVLVSLLAFFLLSPLVKTIVRDTEKPVILLAIDNSQSILINKDSAYYAGKFNEELKQFTEDLSKKYEVRSYLFGKNVTESETPDYSETATDFSNMFKEIRTRSMNRNIGAMIVMSDGLYNKGSNPLNSTRDFRFPLYTVALGDTNLNRDLFFGKVQYNKATFLGNKFPVEVSVRASRLQNSRSNLELTHNGKSLYSREIFIQSGNYSENISILLDARETGIQHYRLKLEPIEGEISTLNNVRDIYIDVLEGKEKVLLYADAPHPDISAIRQAIESSLNFELSIAYPGETSGIPADYDILILHQLPSVKNAADPILSSASARGIPVWYILGGTTQLRSFNLLKQGIQILSDKAVFTEMEPAYADFSLFTLSEETRKIMSEFPPLYGPFGEYRQQNGLDILAYQQINGIKTDRPLFVFGQDPQKKFAVLAGEGLWKWRITNYNSASNFNAFDEIVIKTLQYLSVKVNKSFFRIIHERNFAENEPILIRAEVYNKSYELITDPEVEFTLKNEEGKTFPYAFTKSDNGYSLNLGILPGGVYQYLAKTRVGNEVYQQAGSFTVSLMNLETFSTSADHNLMHLLASRHNGSMVLPADLPRLAEMINAREDIKTIRYSHKSYTELLNMYWVMILLLLLPGLEWFLRKRAGSY